MDSDTQELWRAGHIISSANEVVQRHTLHKGVLCSCKAMQQVSIMGCLCLRVLPRHPTWSKLSSHSDKEETGLAFSGASGEQAACIVSKSLLRHLGRMPGAGSKESSGGSES